MTTPILATTTRDKCLQAITRYLQESKWKAWGLDKLKKAGNAILLTGPAGTGKTTTATWLAKQLGKGMRRLNTDKIGSPEPGGTERNVRAFFESARKNDNPTLFLDECDDLFVDRETCSEQTWKIGTAEAIMLEMNVYRGLIICATNFLHKLDKALCSRFLAIIEIGMPTKDLLIELWQSKIPEEFPLQPSAKQLATLASYSLTGRQVENAIILCASEAIQQKVEPDMVLLQKAIKTIIAQEIK